MERDRYFTGEEAVAYGLVDRVIERASSAGGHAASAIADDPPGPGGRR